MRINYYHDCECDTYRSYVEGDTMDEALDKMYKIICKKVKVNMGYNAVPMTYTEFCAKTEINDRNCNGDYEVNAHYKNGKYVLYCEEYPYGTIENGVFCEFPEDPENPWCVMCIEIEM